SGVELARLRVVEPEEVAHHVDIAVAGAAGRVRLQALSRLVEQLVDEAVGEPGDHPLAVWADVFQLPQGELDLRGSQVPRRAARAGDDRHRLPTQQPAQEAV